MKDTLFISDDYVFGPTIQGEGPFNGYPAIFLRLGGCNLTCKGYKSKDAPYGCDTFMQWNLKHEITFDELNTYFEVNNFVNELKNGKRLIITGGEPLIQQNALAKWIIYFIKAFNFTTLNIDFETNATIIPFNFINYIDENYQKNTNLTINFICCPKLSSNGDPQIKRYNPLNLIWFKNYISFGESFFKFVVNDYNDIKEIKDYYVNLNLIPNEKIWLMPLAGSREELINNSEKVVKWCIENNWKFSNRTHIMVWDKKLKV